MPDSEHGPQEEDRDKLVPRLKTRMRALRRQLRSTGWGDRLERLDESYVEEGAQSVTETDLDTVVEKADAIEDRFRDNGPLRRLLDDGRSLLGLVQDVRRGRYTQAPVWTLSAAGFALLYVLNPMDVVPDALPLVGVLDDAAVVSACLALLEQDLYDYRAWLREQDDTAADKGPTENPPANARTDLDKTDSEPSE
ncbi:MAG: hypothetical protein BRD55_03225 [Bacteroidetes bacterium SW_9_63_38]|nr:MAG: hypothetical protein BRD55_03225 [Bacteroidetes bacterium SW_9_63_38]